MKKEKKKFVRWSLIKLGSKKINFVVFVILICDGSYGFSGSKMLGDFSDF